MNVKDKRKLTLLYNKLNSLLDLIFEVYDIPHTLKYTVISDLFQKDAFNLFLVVPVVPDVILRIKNNIHVNNQFGAMPYLYYTITNTINEIAKYDFQSLTAISPINSNQLSELIYKPVLKENIIYYNESFNMLVKISQDTLNNVGP